MGGGAQLGRRTVGDSPQLCAMHIPVFNDFDSVRRKNRVSRHEIAVFNGRQVEYSLTTGNTCHFRRSSARKPLTTGNTCHEMDFYLREEVEIIEYRKYVPPISRIQRQIIEYGRRGQIAHGGPGRPSESKRSDSSSLLLATYPISQRGFPESQWPP